jgi:DNA-binding MarR family transcriptional regulator
VALHYVATDDIRLPIAGFHESWHHGIAPLVNVEGGPTMSTFSQIGTPISKADFESIAAFRYAIRRFLRFSEQAARREGITPQQHQLLLAVKGFPNRDHASVSELAERLQMRQHSTVGLIDRSEAQNLVRREQGVVDRRQVFVHLTPAGEAVLQHLAVQHQRELMTMREALLAVR